MARIVIFERSLSRITLRKFRIVVVQVLRHFTNLVDQVTDKGIPSVATNNSAVQMVFQRLFFK